MQRSMNLEPCHKCGVVIQPDEPAWQCASVDIVGGRVVTTPVRYEHGIGGCEAAVRRREAIPRTE